MKKLLLLLVMCVIGYGAGFAQSTVSGVVSDGDGIPVEGAAVVGQNTTVGTLTDAQGRYTLRVPEGCNTLVVSYLGAKQDHLQRSVDLDDQSQRPFNKVQNSGFICRKRSCPS